MAVYSAAYELQFNRFAAGAEILPDGARIHRSLIPWVDTGVELRNTLQRGFVPMPATGRSPVTKIVHGRSTCSVGGPLSFSANSYDEFALVNGVLATSLNGPVIDRCGYSNLFIGRGRAAPGDCITAQDDLRTALLNGGVAQVLIADCHEGPGYDDDINADGSEPWQTGVNGCLWQSHLGLLDFVDDAINESTRQNEIYGSITTNASSYTLPNGEIIKNCSYAAMSPEGIAWILAADYGAANNIPVLVTSNTANAFRLHPGVFLRNVGGSYVKSVTRRWRDEISIVAANTGSQPIGILQLTNATVQSKWLVVIDGVASVVFIGHPEGTDYRRPKDIWNNVIVPLITSTGSDTVRISTRDIYGNVLGTETRWQYLSYARYLGSEGTTQQDGTPLPT